MRTRIITDLDRLRQPSELVAFNPKARFLAERLTTEARGRLGPSGGGGLAAPQIGVFKQAFYWQFKPSFVGRDDTPLSGVCCNPTVTHEADTVTAGWERCLSMPAVKVMVERPDSITVEWFTPDGEPQQAFLLGICARIWSHEIDHLNGVVSVDRQVPGQEPVPV